MIRIALFIFVVFTANIIAQTQLSGTLFNQTFRADGNPYIVESDVTVPSNSKVVFEPGCILLFSPFTTFLVHGSLSVSGTSDNPVIFTSINDIVHNPNSQQPANSFDWNGITIFSDASDIHIKSMHLKFTVFGLKSQKEIIHLKNCVFSQNGQFHFTISDKIQPVKEEIPFSYMDDEIVINKEEKIKKPFIQRPASSALGGTLTLIGALGAAGTGVAFTIMSINEDEKSVDSSVTPTQSKNYQKKSDQFFNNSIICYSGTGVFSLVSFFIWRNYAKKVKLEKTSVQIDPINKRVMCTINF